MRDDRINRIIQSFTMTPDDYYGRIEDLPEIRVVKDFDTKSLDAAMGKKR